jgi:hypothetical protein
MLRIQKTALPDRSIAHRPYSRIKGLRPQFPNLANREICRPEQTIFSAEQGTRPGHFEPIREPSANPAPARRRVSPGPGMGLALRNVLEESANRCMRRQAIVVFPSFGASRSGLVTSSR